MKRSIFLILFLISATPVLVIAQDNKEVSSCSMYLNEAVVKEVTKEDLVEWCKQVPPQVKCDDGRVYSIEQMRISFLSLKPFMNTDFGIGEKGVPIKALQAVEKGNSGDAFILKEVKYIGESGEMSDLPVISFKIK